MSIRGIDTQIMITRTADFARETSSIQRQPETNLEHLASQTKVESAHDQSRVQSATESEMDNVRTDVDGSGSGAAGGGGSGQDKEETPEEQIRELLVAPAQHDQLIDIMW